jgi:hypothetical protein
VIGDQSLEDALDSLGVSHTSTLFRIEIEDGRTELKFPGWISVSGDEGHFQLSPVLN